jgi:hypothetical protein
MPKWNIGEKTAALLPSLIEQAGITNPIVGVEETKTLVRFYLLATPEPVVVRKPKPPVKRAASTPRLVGRVSQPGSLCQQTKGKKSAPAD